MRKWKKKTEVLALKDSCYWLIIYQWHKKSNLEHLADNGSLKILYGKTQNKGDKTIINTQSADK